MNILKFFFLKIWEVNKCTFNETHENNLEKSENANKYCKKKIFVQSNPVIPYWIFKWHFLFNRLLSIILPLEGTNWEQLGIINLRRLPRYLFFKLIFFTSFLFDFVSLWQKQSGIVSSVCRFFKFYFIKVDSVRHCFLLLFNSNFGIKIMF